ncbi:hypothetical protein ACHAWF_004240, partial [Thalassiosira exigua]
STKIDVVQFTSGSFSTSNLIKLLVLIILAALLIILASSILAWRRWKQKKKAEEGWRKTKKDGWLRLDLPSDSMLRIGVTHRPCHCLTKTKSSDHLSVHYNGTLFSNSKEFDSSILRREPFVLQVIKKKRINEGSSWSSRRTWPTAMSEDMARNLPTKSSQAQRLSTASSCSTEDATALNIVWGL